MLFVCQVTVSKKVRNSWYNFFFSLFFYLQGTVISRFISPCLKICPRFFKLLKKPFSWSVRKLQRAKLWLLYPIAYPSSKHELDLNTERQHKQLLSDFGLHVQASYAVRKHGIWFKSFFVWSAHSDHSLQNTFEIYSRDSWRTRHICSLAIDIFSKQQSVEQQWCAPFPQQNPHPSWGQASKVYFHTTS